MSKTWVLVPLANDAVIDRGSKRYLDIGTNTKDRIKEAVKWAEEKIPLDEHLWVFGAGTHVDYRFGLTLAQRAEVYLRSLVSSVVQVVSNHADKNYYGTLEEMKWSVKAVYKRHHPGTVTFVFFGPWWHLLRVRLSWRLFFEREWGRALFVATNDSAKPSWWHELHGHFKIIGHRLFPHWIKTRDQTPYPPVVTRSGQGC